MSIMIVPDRRRCSGILGQVIGSGRVDEAIRDFLQKLIDSQGRGAFVAVANHAWLLVSLHKKMVLHLAQLKKAEREKILAGRQADLDVQDPKSGFTFRTFWNALNSLDDEIVRELTSRKHSHGVDRDSGKPLYFSQDDARREFPEIAARNGIRLTTKDIKVKDFEAGTYDVVTSDNIDILQRLGVASTLDIVINFTETHFQNDVGLYVPDLKKVLLDVLNGLQRPGLKGLGQTIAQAVPALIGFLLALIGILTRLLQSKIVVAGAAVGIALILISIGIKIALEQWFGSFIPSPQPPFVIPPNTPENPGPTPMVVYPPDRPGVLSYVGAALAVALAGGLFYVFFIKD